MTAIEWTHPPGFRGESWNPFVGCSIVSKGCTNCYAMKMASRIIAMQGEASHYAETVKTVKGKPVWTGAIREASEKVWTAPLRAREPRCYFVNSMGDVFHEDVPDAWIDRLFAVAALSPKHRFLILTKRPERMREYINGIQMDVPALGRMPLERVHMKAASHIEGDGGFMDVLKARGNVYSLYLDTPWPLPNVWLGVSVEDQASADERIPHLLATPAAIRFISAEPLLEPIWPWYLGISKAAGPAANNAGIDWVIVGGESGPGARVWPGFEDACRSLRDQCAAAQVPFFMKQMAGAKKSAMPPIPNDLAIRQWPEQSQ